MRDFCLKNKKLLLGIFVLAIFYLYLAHLGSYHLMDPDEGRYNQIPREMLLSGDFITPHLNGVEYFEKPAFQYWFTAIMMKIFGVTEFAGRILPALSAIGCVGLAGFLPTKAKNELGWNPQSTSFEELVRIMVTHDMQKVAAEHVASVMRTNLAEYLEKGIVK